jgi:hypothetical protein
MDLYTDYLLNSFGHVAATGLPELLDGGVSHDKILENFSAKMQKVFYTRKK